MWVSPGVRATLLGASGVSTAATAPWTRTCPAFVPPSELAVAPAAKDPPSPDSATEKPKRSSVASPPTSSPIWTQAIPDHWKTRTTPASARVAPTASRLPLSDNDTDVPNRSATSAPSKSEPSCVQAEPLHWKTRTWPASFPASSFCGAPTARDDPSAESDTARPEKSPAASPSISPPTCVQTEATRS